MAGWRGRHVGSGKQERQAGEAGMWAVAGGGRTWTRSRAAALSSVGWDSSSTNYLGGGGGGQVRGEEGK